jgi:hypothetical protein
MILAIELINQNILGIGLNVRTPPSKYLVHEFLFAQLYQQIYFSTMHPQRYENQPGAAVKNATIYRPSGRNQTRALRSSAALLSLPELKSPVIEL